MPKKVIISVTNDLTTDQRVNKVANTLLKFGYSPVLIGVKRHKSQVILPRKYATKRLCLLFHRGFLFYANYNISLFFYLLFNKFDILVSNDLDSLSANYFAYKIKTFIGRKQLKLVYDSHELFTEVPELYNRKFVRNVWLKIEQFILPKLSYTYTVCQSIANYYDKKYKTNMYVIKNMPLCEQYMPKSLSSKLKLPENYKIILYQGALNIGRGIEQIINVMNELDKVIFLVVGKGDIEANLHKMVADKGLNDKVWFTGAMPFEQLKAITKQADIGLVLQEERGLSYHYALPNRLFDFIQAGVPILASNQPEISNIVNSENIGLVVDNLSEKSLLLALNNLLNNEKLICEFKANLKNCASDYCWERQEEVLRKIFCCP